MREAAGYRSRWGAVATAVALFTGALLAFHLLRPRELDRKLDSDENQYIAISVQHYQQLVHGGLPVGYEGNTSDAVENPWRAGVHATNWGFHIPSLPKLCWGFALDRAGVREATTMVYPDYHRGDQKLLKEGMASLMPAMPTARLVVLLLAAFTAVFMHRIGAMLAGPAGAALAYAFWILSPLVFERATYIRIDFFQLAFSLACLSAAISMRAALAGRRGWARMQAAAMVLGVLSGCAVSSKLSGAYNCFAVGVWIPLLWWGSRRETGLGFWIGPLPALCLAGLASIGVFYVTNPFLWTAPIEGISAMLARWDELMAWLEDVYPIKHGIAHSLPERVALAGRKVFGTHEPWRAWTGLPLGLVLVPAGLWLLLARCRDSEPARVALAFVVVCAVVVTVWLPIEIPRYFLPYQPIVVLLEALVLAAAAGRLLGRIQPSRT
jgi:hypothetical protein